MKTYSSSASVDYPESYLRSHEMSASEAMIHWASRAAGYVALGGVVVVGMAVVLLM